MGIPGPSRVFQGMAGFKRGGKRKAWLDFPGHGREYKERVKSSMTYLQDMAGYRRDGQRLVCHAYRTWQGIEGTGKEWHLIPRIWQGIEGMGKD